MAKKNPVVVTLTVDANPGITTEEIDRAEWNAMSPKERTKMIDEMALDFLNNQGGWGWSISDPDDAVEV